MNIKIDIQKNFKRLVNKVQNNTLLTRSKIITQGTKLSKKQDAITDQKQIQAQIEKWQKAAKGQIKGKNGKILNPKYCKEKISLFKKKLNGSTKTSNNTDFNSKEQIQKNIKTIKEWNQKLNNKPDNNTKLIIYKKMYDLYKQTDKFLANSSSEVKKQYKKFIEQSKKNINKLNLQYNQCQQLADKVVDKKELKKGWEILDKKERELLKKILIKQNKWDLIGGN